MGAYRQTLALFDTLATALASPATPGTSARTVANRLAVRQVFHTGFEALPLVSVIAAFAGATVILQTKMVPDVLPTEMIGQVLVAVILRELAPLATATIVASRSGTAIATELGNMQANSEVLGLSSLGIDPARFIVWPRIVGSTVAVLVLTIYFGVVAIVSAYAVDFSLGASSFSSLRAGFAEALEKADLLLYLVKCSGLGLLVGWLPCHFGLQVGASPTEVPQRASHAVVMSLLACIVFNTVVTGAFYWIVGPPVR